MASSSDSIFGITTPVITIPTGVTLAVQWAPGAYVRAVILKYASGGSVNIFGVQTGASLTGTSLIAGYSSSYLLSTSEILSIGGPAWMYLAATGSTASVYMLEGLSNNVPTFETVG